MGVVLLNIKIWLILNKLKDLNTIIIDKLTVKYKIK